MAAVHHFVYTGGGREVIPREATHVSIHDSITVIPAELFQYHPNIVELICHEGVLRIEGYVFGNCRRLRRVIIPGVKIILRGAFGFCTALIFCECPKLETIGEVAFIYCKLLSSINLQSVKVVSRDAFIDSALSDAVFGNDLESVESQAFYNCRSLERITLPLKEDVITSDNAFHYCDKLSRVDLIERAVIYETIAVLLVDKWRDDMSDEIDSIIQRLSNANPWEEKAPVIREWIERIRSKIVGYKAQHHRVLKEANALLRLSLPNDIVTNNIMCFLELPPHSFEGEIGVVETDGMPE